MNLKRNLASTYEEREEKENWLYRMGSVLHIARFKKQDKVVFRHYHPNVEKFTTAMIKPLAINGSGIEIGIIPEKFNVEADAEELATLLGTTPEYINEQFNQSWVQPDHFVPIKQIAFTQTK